MIKSIEIWDFESHEHTLLADLSAGFNLIFGESNAGKTSILRAVKLVAYNEFDPKSVRVGQKSCSVQVITDKGRVKVTKPSNEWEIEPNGKPTEYYEKIGKNILPEAAEIIGMSMVQLGDIEMPVNVMNQLEGHFMLSELNGKVASGSARAQIIDEISGLSGIEGVIKEVSLDNHRWGRDVKQTEERIEELAGQLYDPTELGRESSLLDDVQKCLKDRDDCKTIATNIETLCGKVITEGDAIDRIDLVLKGLPDEQVAKGLLDTGEAALKKATAASTLAGAWKIAAGKSEAIETELGTTVDTARVEKCLDDAQKAFDAAKVLRPIHKDATSHKNMIADFEEALVTSVNELADAEVERDKILASIKVCPLTQMPIGRSCQTSIETSPAVISAVAKMVAAEIIPDIKTPVPEIETQDYSDKGDSDGLFDW